MGLIKFTKKPSLYDWLGVPVYISSCGMYRLVHHRSGPVRKGKAEHDYWHVHFLRSKNDWITIRNRCGAKRDAIECARTHHRLLTVQIQLEKELDGSNSSDAGSRSTRSRRNKDSRTSGKKRDHGKRPVSKRGHKRHA